MGKKVSWSDLPEDLLTKIGKCLDADFDIIRFRSVCSRWRYSLPADRRDSSPSSQIPIPSSQIPISKGLYMTFLKTTVCILNQYPVSTPISKPWLFKLEETPDKKFRVINPISDAPVKDLPAKFPKFLNLLDYPILEVARGYICTSKHLLLKDDEEARLFVLKKVVTLPESSTFEDENSVILFLFHKKLLLLRNGDEEYKVINKNEDEDGFLDDKNKEEFGFDDIAVYRGRFVVVDRRGAVSFVDYSSSKLIQYTPPILNDGREKHLVVSSEILYVVDRYINRALNQRVVAFKAYKLDEDRGWVEVLSLDDRILIIGARLNFFVPIKDLGGCNGDCIYFLDHYNRSWYGDEELNDALIGSTGRRIAVFNLANGKIRNLSSPGCSEMFWPPPTWFTAN